MKVVCLFLILGLAASEEGPQDAAYWAAKAANQNGGNIIKKPNAGVALRQKATSASDYWAQKKAAKSTGTAQADYWTQKKLSLAKNGPDSQSPKANLKATDSEYEPCPNGRIPMNVVSLSNRYDRWDRMSIRWNGMMLMHPEVCIDMERFDATNGAKDPIPLKLVTKTWNTARNRKYVGNGTWYDKVDDTLELTPGERGCAASHVRLWKKVAKMDGPAILLEDDAIPVDGFADKLTKGLKDIPKDADLLYLGYSKPDKAPWIRELPGTDLAQAEYVWTTVGYMIWPSGARKLLQRLPVDSPVDNYMSWASHENVTNVYAFKTPVIKQELPWNLASDVEHSDENNKNAKENMNSFHSNQDLKQKVSLLTRPFIAAQNSFHQMWTETMKGADEWMEESEQEKSQSTKELEAIEAEH
eukprot:gnl/MRDRNA2_/MRDRNA2_86188_c0_seq11.p1 gnl/MRDRNA2_/MRDRNA2_86188_c0~~gnl/MRDRNA2_/MRDRNA2_86188_c0_seq11.p1  ORF type:complete len:414 (+),score=119.00 gnl/MRDRNA2_/MRDRNA2_86188_c0_seq11:71-1312(+)